MDNRKTDEQKDQQRRRTDGKQTGRQIVFQPRTSSSSVIVSYRDSADLLARQMECSAAGSNHLLQRAIVTQEEESIEPLIFFTFNGLHVSYSSCQAES